MGGSKIEYIRNIIREDLGPGKKAFLSRLFDILAWGIAFILLPIIFCCQKLLRRELSEEEIEIIAIPFNILIEGLILLFLTGSFIFLLNLFFYLIFFL